MIYNWLLIKTLAKHTLNVGLCLSPPHVSEVYPNLKVIESPVHFPFSLRPSSLVELQCAVPCYLTHSRGEGLPGLLALLSTRGRLFCWPRSSLDSASSFWLSLPLPLSLSFLFGNIFLAAHVGTGIKLKKKQRKKKKAVAREASQLKSCRSNRKRTRRWKHDGSALPYCRCRAKRKRESQIRTLLMKTLIPSWKILCSTAALGSKCNFLCNFMQQWCSRVVLVLVPHPPLFWSLLGF